MNEFTKPKFPEKTGKYSKTPREAITKPEMAKINPLIQATAREVNDSLEPDLLDKKKVVLAKTVIEIGEKIQKLNTRRLKITVDIQKSILLLRTYINKGYDNLTTKELDEAEKIAARLSGMLDEVRRKEL